MPPRSGWTRSGSHFPIGLALVLGLIIGVVPSLQLNGLNVNSILREEDGRARRRNSRNTRRALVVAQVALAFVLLCGAGLLFASFSSRWPSILDSSRTAC